MPDGKTFETRALPGHNYNFSVFDIVVNHLIQKGGKAFKGNGRNARLGAPPCELDTVVGVIGNHYFNKNVGSSVWDPVHVLAAILEWADICKNERGYIELAPTYMALLS